MRSGKYKQGFGKLRNVEKDSFCCLGVLCDVVKKDLGGYWDKEFPEKFVVHGTVLEDMLDDDIAEELGIPLEQQSTLTKLNDGNFLPYTEKGFKHKGYKKFKTIAKMLENGFLDEEPV